jgi:hypothetical protein
MKTHSLLLSLCALLYILILALPEARAEQKGLLLLAQPRQYVEIDYDFRDQRVSTNKGSSSSSDLNRFSPSYFISLPFAIYNPDIFLADIHTLVKYEQDFLLSPNGLSQSNSTVNFYYGVAGTFTRKKPLTASFYANSQKSWIQEEFSPGHDVTSTNYGAEVNYKNAFLPLRVRYDHNESEFTNLRDFQSYNDNNITIQTQHRYRDFMQSNLILQDRWIRNINSASTPAYTNNELSANLNNSVSWKFSPTTPGYLTSSLDYMKTTGTQALTTAQITETLSQSLGKALKSGASYSYSVQQSPLESTHTQAGNIFISHQLFDSLRTLINLQGTSNQFGGGTQNQLTGTGTLIYQKKLPHDSTIQFQLSDSYQWNQQQLANPLRTQFNETINITDISLRFPLANQNVTSIIEVWNKDHTIQFQDPADFGTFVIGNLTYITINPTGQIHSGEVLHVTYRFLLDTDITFVSNTVSASGNLSLFGNFCSIFAQFSDTQRNLIGGNDILTLTGNSRSASVGAEGRMANQTFGVKYNSTSNPSISQDSLNAYWWFAGAVGKNLVRVSVTDTFNFWVDNNRSVNAHNNAIDASTTVTRQFSRSSQGSLGAGYIRTDGSSNQDSAYLKLNYTYVLGKFQFWATAQSLLHNYTNQSLINNSISLMLRRNF